MSDQDKPQETALVMREEDLPRGLRKAGGYAQLPALNFSPQQEQMIRDMFARDASNEEFSVLMEVAKARRLNPLLKEIHFMKRWDNDLNRYVWSAMVSIEGLRTLAERTGEYEGQDPPKWEYEDGEGGKKWLVAAYVTVYRTGRKPCTGVAYYEEFLQTKRDGNPNRMWATMPRNQLAKCAEAMAFRKIFPNETGGLNVPEEFNGRDDGSPTEAHKMSGAAPVQAAAQQKTNEVERMTEHIRACAMALPEHTEEALRVLQRLGMEVSASRLTGPERKELVKIWNEVNDALKARTAGAAEQKDAAAATSTTSVDEAPVDDRPHAGNCPAKIGEKCECRTPATEVG